MSDFRFPSGFRDAIASALPEQSSQHGEALGHGQLYLPVAHVKALDPNTMVVVGMRGAGKSVWLTALQDSDTRKWLGTPIGIDDTTIVTVGFKERPEGIDAFPTKDALVALIKENEPRLIWKTLVYRQVIRKDAPQAFLRLKTWGDRVRWVTENPERVDEGIFQQDQALQAKRRFHLVLFDALDRTADDWKTMNRLVRGLLQVVLDMRAYKRIRLKVFLRPDQISDPEVRGFPDASKLLDGKESLNWSQRDLYGLLWRYLANGTESGDVFRRGCQKIVPKAKWANDFFGDYEVPPLLNQDEETQTEIFHAITGPWMGRDQRRGFPYSWLHGHLCDVHNMVSPRSFLAAIRHAALDRRDDHDFPIHFESIKLGVQAASRIRVEELEEDFPWMKELFKPLRGMNVPCPLEAFEEKWIASKTLESLKATAVRHPQRIELGSVGILNDLLDLGFVEQLKDKRINLPDVYRVGYGLGRKGGVKPLKTRE